MVNNTPFEDPRSVQMVCFYLFFSRIYTFYHAIEQYWGNKNVKYFNLLTYIFWGFEMSCQTRTYICRKISKRYIDKWENKLI